MTERRGPGPTIEESNARYKAALEADVIRSYDPKAAQLYQEVGQVSGTLLSDEPDPYIYPESSNRDESRMCDEVGMSKKIRAFATGATRDVDNDKLDYEGALSPIVLRRYCQYMKAQRLQADGSVRADDNWQKGIPKNEYMRSKLRHDMDLWIAHRSGLTDENAACAILFNTMGYLFEILKDAGIT